VCYRQNLHHFADQIIKATACITDAKKEEVTRVLIEEHTQRERERQESTDGVEATSASITTTTTPSLRLDETTIKLKAKSQIGIVDPRSFTVAEVSYAAILCTPAL
jgi:hypothetical protein